MNAKYGIPAALLVVTAPVWAGYGGDGPTAAEAAWVRAHVGMYVWGPGRQREYVRGDREALTEMAARLGTRIVRSTTNAYPEAWRYDYDPRLPTWIDSLHTPGWQALIDANDVVIITLGDMSGRQFEPEWTAAHYRRLTEYLLSRYSSVAKTFVLGIWEGDHWLTEASMAEDPAKVETYTRFFEARHRGIAEGRASVPGSRSKVLEMIEVVSLDYEGRKYLTNRVVPQTHADLYSLSSWGYQYELVKALGYIKTRAPDSDAFGARNCMIGEAGGPADWVPPAERVAKTRAIIAQARQWGVPYLIWWELCGGYGEGNSVLQAPPYDGGVKLAPHYWFYRAYHDADDPLVVENFEADPNGPSAGDYSPEGYSLNCLGGRRSVTGEVSACLVPGGRTGQRSLWLRFGEGGGGWSTELLHLDARRRRELRLAVRGDAARLAVTLTDGAGHAARAPFPAADRKVAHEWRTMAIGLNRFRDVDRRDLAALTVESVGPAECRLDDIALAAEGSAPARPKRNQELVSKAAHLMVSAARQPIVAPGSPAARLLFARVVAAAGGVLKNPRLTDGETTISLGAELRAGEVLELVPGGTSHLRLGPFGYLLDVKHPEQCGLSATNLNGLPEYHCFQPAGDGRDCRLEWQWQSDYPVRHFRIAVYGEARAQSKAGIAVLVSPNGAQWAQTRLDERTFQDGCWIARPPVGFVPTRNLRLRVELQPDRSLTDWPWTVSVSDLKVELWLDSADCRGPRLDGLQYTDDGPASGYRGLLDLDW